MTDQLTRSLEEVMGLAEKATPGELQLTDKGWIESSLGVDVCEYRGCGSHEAEWNNLNDFLFIATAVNFLRQNAPAILTQAKEVAELRAEVASQMEQNRLGAERELAFLDRAETAEAKLAAAEGDAMELRKLLEIAVCPNASIGCDGEQYPAGDPHGEHWGEQCQWCYERKAAIATGAGGG